MKSSVLLVLCLSLSSLAFADEPAFLGDAACKVVMAPPQAQDRARWTGPCKDGYADGEGVLELFKDNAPGARFEGRLEHGMLAEGYLKTAAGQRYEGQFKDGRREGTGVLINAAGDRYDGAWKNGRREGRGSQAFTLGGRYDGDWKADRFDGRGSLTYAGGHQVTGMFLRGSLVDSPRPAVVAATAPAAPAADEHFKIKADAAQVGSNLKRDVAISNGIPFDKGYAEMTPAQQARVRAHYALLEDGDEPPYPVGGVQQYFKWVSQTGEKLDAPTGRLRLLVQVDSSGKASSVSLFETPDPKLGEVATAMLMQASYKPAICRGKPCAMAYPFELMMTRRLN